MKISNILKKIDQWDQKIILKYNGMGGKPITYILKFFSFFGRETIWLYLIAFYLLIWYDPFLLSYISTTFLIGLVLILVIKQAVKRKRPFESFKEDKIIVFERRPISRSFPSWHAYNIVANGLLIGFFFLNSLFITILFLGFACIVCFSRIQLGVHYPSDVIFGSIFGIIGFLIAIYLMGPLLVLFLSYLEQFSTYEIHYQQINPLLISNLGYFLLSLIIFVLIFLLAIEKQLRSILRENKK